MIRKLQRLYLSEYNINYKYEGMKEIKIAILVLFLTILPVSMWSQNTSKTPFEGVITTRITMGKVDASTLLGKIDYKNKEKAKQQMNTLFSDPQIQPLVKRDSTTELLLMMTPPNTIIYLKGDQALAKTKGIGFQIEHYRNLKTDEAFVYTSSLLNPSKAVTATYKPSQGNETLFAQDKRLNLKLYNIVKLSEKEKVAGYDCSVTSYTLKKKPSAADKSIQVHKLKVYTSKDMTNAVNFASPYYLVEKDGIMRIDVFFDDSKQPTMIYEMTKVEKKPIDNKLLQIKKTKPLYQLTNVDYSMKLMKIIMGGIDRIWGEK